MKQAKILIADGEKYLRELYTEILGGEGYIIDAAEDGEHVLTKMLNGYWDLVLLEADLPKINGFEVVRKLREHPDLEKETNVLYLYLWHQ